MNHNRRRKHTSESHLACRGQHRFQHFTDFNIPQSLPDVLVTHAILNQGHDSQHDKLVSRRVASLELAVRDCATEFRQSNIQINGLCVNETADKETVQGCECGRCYRAC